MKQTIALIMAVAVLACTLSMTSFAATINFPVASVSSKVYVENEDNQLSLKSPASKVKYGETAYFPLLSKGSNAVIAAKDALDKAKVALSQAQSNYDAAKQTCENYEGARKNYTDRYNEDQAAQKAISTYDTTKAELDKALAEAKATLAQAESDRDSKKALYDQAVKLWEAAGSPELDSGTSTVVSDKSQAYTVWQAAVTKAGQEADKVTQATTAINNLGTRESKVSAQTATKNALESAETAFKTTTHTSTVDLAKAAVTTAQTAQTTANTNLVKAQNDVTTAQTTYDNAVKAGNTYLYVYESAAIDKIKINKKWEESENYASNVEIVRKRVIDDIPGASSSSMRSIYFLAIKIKSGSTTQSRDLLGTVTLKKSGSDGFTINANIGIELGYSSASGSGGEIGKTARTFKDGDGFDAEDDFEFSFEADGKSKFIVDTSGQGKIVLSFNRDFDDKIERKYPDAGLEYFNGNYASFNRVGTLYLGSKIDDGYVYEISKTGDLSRVSSKYNDNEEAYEINTRTLGRYVISQKKLAISSSSSSSTSTSGSGTGTGTGTGTGGTGTTVVPTAPSTPSYTYTPPKPSASSSSAAPPAQSSSSSEESEEESQSESEPEELEDEDDIVDVVIDDKDTEGPEEKSGIPVWVWALIIVGLAAIPIGIGVVYYLHSRPLRRDFFNEEEDEYDDDDDED